MVRMGGGEFIYESYENWAKLPEGWTFREVPDVACGADERVYVFSRGDHKMVVFDREGNLVDSWGAGLFERPHGVTVDPDGSLLLSFPVADCRELTRNILSYGAEVRVIAPPELQILVREEIEQMNRMYSSPDTA